MEKGVDESILRCIGHTERMENNWNTMSEGCTDRQPQGIAEY